jgi:hypothetical protein
MIQVWRQGHTALLSDIGTGFMNEPRPESPSNLAASLPETSCNTEAQTMMFNQSIELNLYLDSDYYDIEGLLSTKGSEWFTGAVL